MIFSYYEWKLKRIYQLSMTTKRRTWKNKNNYVEVKREAQENKNT